MTRKLALFALSFVFATVSLACGSGSEVGNQAALSIGTTPLVSGFAMPDLQNEKETYTNWGWTWAQSVEPNFPGDSSYNVGDPDQHYGGEGDDLWSYLMMYLRTGEQGYLDRATAWKNYYLAARSSNGYFFDWDSFGSDHMYGWGLIAWYEYNGEQAALAEAENLATVVEDLWTPSTSTFSCYPSAEGCMQWGIRGITRQLHLVTRVAEITDKQQWIDLRDKILTTLMNSSYWNDQFGMYFGESSTVSSFQIGILTETMAQAYRVTGRQDIRDRMIAMARFIDQYGLDPTYQYSGAIISVDTNGNVSHGPVTLWDSVYTTALVNTLVWGYKLTGEQKFLDSAQYFFNRGTKGVYGSATARTAGDSEVGHFIDTQFDTSWGNFYLANNKGELQYTHMIFENDGFPTVLGSTPPTPAPTLTISVSSASITSGSSSTVSWSSVNATACTASGGWSGAKAVSGTQDVSPTIDTTYTLTCTGLGGSSTQSTTVTVNPAPAPTLTISVSQASITSGDSSTLSWSSVNATACTASGGWSGPKAVSGTQSVSPTIDTTYTLTCTGLGGSSTQSVTLTVTPASDNASGGCGCRANNNGAGLSILLMCMMLWLRRIAPRTNKGAITRRGLYSK